MKKNRGITLIALVITIIVLLILAGISMATLTGENGVLTKASDAATKTDIVETKEQIKLEIMGNTDKNGNYTNEDVKKAVKKVTDNEVDENAPTVLSKKKNSVDIADLWEKDGVSFNVCGLSITCQKNTTMLSALTEWYNVHREALHKKMQELGSEFENMSVEEETNEVVINIATTNAYDKLHLLKERTRSYGRAINQ